MIVIVGVALGVFLSSDQDEDGAPIHTASVESNPADVSVDESESKISVSNCTFVKVEVVKSWSADIFAIKSAGPEALF